MSSRTLSCASEYTAILRRARTAAWSGGACSNLWWLLARVCSRCGGWRDSLRYVGSFDWDTGRWYTDAPYLGQACGLNQIYRLSLIQNISFSLLLCIDERQLWLLEFLGQFVFSAIHQDKFITFSRHGVMRSSSLYNITLYHHSDSDDLHVGLVYLRVVDVLRIQWQKYRSPKMQTAQHLIQLTMSHVGLTANLYTRYMGFLANLLFHYTFIHNSAEAKRSVCKGANLTIEYRNQLYHDHLTWYSAQVNNDERPGKL